MDRRKFLTLLAGAGAAACSPGAIEGGVKPNPRVVLLKRPNHTGPKKELMHALIKKLGPLNQLFKSGERVGIKLNCLAGRGLSPGVELVYALTDLLLKAGVSEIIIFERTERELKKAGFKINMGSGVKVMGNDHFSNRYDPEPFLYKSIGSCFCTILTKRIDSLINFGVLKDHDLAGVSAGLKNLFGLIHNPNKYHDNHCSPYVAHVAAADPVRKKLKLTICDGLIAQYHGGPALRKACTWKAGILLASTDPVALDRVALDIIDKKRVEKKMKTLAQAGKPVLFLKEAKKLGLGEDQMERIKLETV